MKSILAIVILFALSACGENDKVGTVRSGDVKYEAICIDGVVYLKRNAGYKGFLTVKFNPDSTVVTCKGQG